MTLELFSYKMGYLVNFGETVFIKVQLRQFKSADIVYQWMVLYKRMMKIRYKTKSVSI